jgi:short-subunit dehydrogenase
MNKDLSKKFALVTGASKGLGKYFALELARRNINTLLVALPGEDLNLVAEQAKSYGTESFYFETDLTIKSYILTLTDQINRKYNVYILINNAGCGGTKSFLECDADYIDHIIQLNITSLSLITRQLLPNLIEQDRSWILNVSSMASFSPIGYKTVYPASKRFVHHFSKGLKQELKNTRVSVSVVYPGPIITNDDVKRRITQQGLSGRIVSLTPEKVAFITVQKLFRGKSFILAGWTNKINWLLMEIIPDRIKIPMLTRIYKKELNTSSV